VLKAIAAEHAKGRILLIGTTNLDAQREVVWNIGKIAASGSPKALELVRDILLASAAIPGVFPPVMIDADVDGAHYQEMHVDGGTSNQIFAYPPALNIEKWSGNTGVVRERHLFMIRNARLEPNWMTVERSTLDIARRAISSLIQTQGMGDIYRMYATAERDRVDFNFAYIPKSFTRELQEPFETAYMQDLYGVGYNLGSQGYNWAKTPPGFAGAEGIMSQP
jgi:hypothetical protein